MSVKSITALCFSLAPTQVTQSGMWLPMIPAGLFSGVDGRTWTNSNPDAVVAAFNKKRPFDVEHSTHIKAPQGEPAPAYGWIMRLENREGEIWGLVDWNSEGRGTAFVRSIEGLLEALPDSQQDAVKAELELLSTLASENGMSVAEQVCAGGGVDLEGLEGVEDVLLMLATHHPRMIDRVQVQGVVAQLRPEA